ncbi:MAG: transcription termination/antitermination protein NusG [Candidatus Rokuibacteriota bacterium]
MNWYAIRTRSRHEKLAGQQLQARAVETLVPLVDRRQRWADRWKTVSFPLFPGYCFARFLLEDRLTVLTALGVVEILGNNAGPVPVAEDEIDAIRTLVTSTLPFDPHPYLTGGMQVEVVRGPLEGVRGILVRKDRRARLVVSIRLIQQAAAVELDAHDVVPAGSAPGVLTPVVPAGRRHDTSPRRQDHHSTVPCRVTAVP